MGKAAVKSKSTKRSRSRSRSRSRVINRRSRQGMKGWGKNKPQTFAQRARLAAKCGKKCFGKPKTLGFPVCRKDCKLDCKGLLAAYTRGRQWRKKNPGVATKVKKMAKKVGCKWADRS